MQKNSSWEANNRHERTRSSGGSSIFNASGEITGALRPIRLDGQSLTTQLLADIGRSSHLRLTLSEDARERINASRSIIDTKLSTGAVAYGVNTGFGLFATTVIPADKLVELQYNLIRSHCAGVGAPAPLAVARMIMTVRLNVFAKGFSGIRLETVDRMLAIFNSGCVPFVPEQGTVGASGDLAPLAHVALAMMGEGKKSMWDPDNEEWADAGPLLARKGLKPIELEAKEGLALINGTQLISSYGSLASTRAQSLLRTADIVGALSLEVLKGTSRAFIPPVHAARPHPGQIASASRLCALLRPKSEIALSHQGCGRVQDSYSLRCIPQVHGVVADTLDFVERIMETEINSATDNPMVVTEINDLVSAGNFHGEYPAKMCDYLCIAVQELANISERRQERMMNNSLNGELPPFLVNEGGLNSGFMIAHCTSAALTSESKTLCHPASVDTISTSAAKEDHVSMGGFAARKALKVVENVETVLAIELLMACQALSILRPLRSTPVLESVFDLVRTRVPELDKDRIMHPDIEAATQLVRSGELWSLVSAQIDQE